ncbi:hypothetical protein AAFF_G00202370 [Aldrovandia affinis]|uniref:Uncharacterized protein n=1 Tax=Aldrovandia affinis TaxID=143900 RepID=A0AAD7SYX0_9TELE|nr:hypothetical protein AAFF_G00202370 [Aldrovandia affinis]
MWIDPGPPHRWPRGLHCLPGTQSLQGTLIADLLTSSQAQPTRAEPRRQLALRPHDPRAPAWLQGLPGAWKPLAPIKTEHAWQSGSALPPSALEIDSDRFHPPSHFGPHKEPDWCFCEVVSHSLRFAGLTLAEVFKGTTPPHYKRYSLP